MFSGHGGTDRYKAVPSGAEREKQREVVPGDPDHEEVSFTLKCINIMNGCRGKHLVLLGPTTLHLTNTSRVHYRTHHAAKLCSPRFPPVFFSWQFVFIRAITGQIKTGNMDEMTCNKGPCCVFVPQPVGHTPTNVPVL